ncbi:MAG: response regulator, partial [Herminiimonas sp.]|nr:response regulator [Herminiimonas sp.]
PIILARALEQNPRNSIDADATIPASAPSRRAVLVVDDSLAVRAYLRSLLEPRGFIVSDADSAEAGIEAAGANPYACILMDVLMPGIDGYEACRRIKARARSGTGAAIVMLTSKSSPFDRIRGKMAGCDAYLTKPVDAHTLYDVLSRYITVPVQNAPPGVAQKWTAGRAAIGSP